MSELVVKFDDKIVVGLNETYVVANVSDYDHYIFVNAEPVDNFTPDIITKFAFEKSVTFVGPNLRVSNTRTVNTVNLDFYTISFKNMFLNMHVNDTESLWLDFISEEKLRTFKQLVLTLKPEDNLRGLNKLNNTHYIINMKNFGDKITITYLRKDIILEPTFEEEDKLIEEIVAVELDFSQEQPHVVEEKAALVDEEEDEVKVIEEEAELIDDVKVIEEEAELIDDVKVIEEESLEEPVIEEGSLEEPVVEEGSLEVPVVEEKSLEEPVVEEESLEEPVVEEESLEEPVKKKRTYNKKKKV
jgi:hypothetical protein